MTPQTPPLVEPIGADEVDAFWQASAQPFGEALDDDTLAFQRALTEMGRTFAVRDRGRMVAMGAAQSLDVSLPGGGVAPMAGVSMLAVLPTHRRRGLGRAMTDRLHAQARERGEPLVGLWASEGGIYRNYGYGVGTRSAMVATTPRTTWRRPGSDEPELHLIDLDAAVPLARSLTDHLRAHRAGVPCLAEERLRRHLFHDPPDWREGHGPRTFVAAEDGRGMASYRIKVDWHDTGPDGTARVDWLIAEDPASEARLWRYLTDVDLVTAVRAFNRPVDEAVGLLAVDARAVETVVSDGLWLRVLDPAAVLSARRYAADGRLVIDVADDDGYAAGRFTLTVEDGVGACTPAAGTALPDLTVPVSSLGAVVLGDERLTRLARAGLADAHTAGALWHADRMLATQHAPWCPFVVE